MIEYRTARPDEYPVYVSFANTVFGAGQTGIDFAELIPKVYQPGADTAWMQHVAVDEKNGIRGLIAMLPCDLQVGSITLKTGYVGTVSVHPEARGEGHMIRLMDDVLSQMRELGCHFAMLGGLRQRYEYFGYVPGGLRWRISISSANLRHALRCVCSEGLSFATVQHDTMLEREAKQLHDEQLVHFDRSWTSFTDISRSYSGELLCICENDEVLGYLIVNAKGNLVRELVLRDEVDLDRVLKAWMEQKKIGHIELELPDWQQERLRHLNGWAEETTLGCGEQIRILRYRDTVEAMLKLKASYTKLADGEMQLEAEGQRFTIRVQDQQVTVEDAASDPIVLSCLEAGRLLTAPFPMNGLPSAPAGWFPLPICAMEADHF